MIPQPFIDDLLRRVDVVEVVGQYVPLKRAGANYSGLCPFHTEKSPSFTVSPSKQFYHCFGCGAHGTALGFLIEHLGLPFPQAVEDLARRVGLEVPREASPEDLRQRQEITDLRTRLKSRLLEAAKFYQRRLKDAPQAVAYLKGRGLSGEIAQRYHLGYAPEGWQSLQAVFGDYEHSDLSQSGLVVEADAGKRYDRFRDRIMFPILSQRGEVLGFGARTLGQDEPKYLNSPETPVFSKGDELYGVFEARSAIREAGQVWVVEGYMDVVALAQHGIGHVVAALGTATTPRHLQTLLRLSDHIVFMFDGDAAGRKAAARALATALPFASEKNRIDFAFLPSGHDPDSLIRESGADALNGLVRSAKPLSAWILDLAAQGQAMEFAEGRAAALAELAGMLKTMPAGPLRSQIVREAARRFDAPESAILNDIGERLPSQIDSRNRYSPRPSSRDQRPTVRPLAERLLQILVRQPDWAGQIPSRLIEHLEATQSALIHWIRAKTQQASVANFAVLHEAALAEGREKGPDEVKLFIKLARPDAALDALEESDPEALRAEFERAISRLTIRFLEEEAKRLTVAAQTDANALGELTRVRAEIQALKA